MLQSLKQANADAGDFLEAVTKTDNVVCHFFHRDFERCKLLDKHLSILARKYFDTRFIQVSAPVSTVQQLIEFCQMCCILMTIGFVPWL